MGAYATGRVGLPVLGSRSPARPGGVPILRSVTILTAAGLVVGQDCVDLPWLAVGSALDPRTGPELSWISAEQLAQNAADVSRHRAELAGLSLPAAASM